MFPRPDLAGMQFPPYQQVTPTFKAGDAGTITIGLNAEYLLALARALAVSKKAAVVELTIKLPKVTKVTDAWDPEERQNMTEHLVLDHMLDPIVVKTSFSSDAIGVLMPARV